MVQRLTIGEVLHDIFSTGNWQLIETTVGILAITILWVFLVYY